MLYYAKSEAYTQAKSTLFHSFTDHLKMAHLGAICWVVHYCSLRLLQELIMAMTMRISHTEKKQHN